MDRRLPAWLDGALAERGGWLDAERTARAAAECGGDARALARLLRDAAAARAHAPVSGFAVGAVALVRDDFGREALALGANFECAGAPLASTVHAEQAALHLARRHGARRLLALALTAPPCGHCRQFLQEAEGADAAAVLLGAEESLSLAALLPRPFGPAALGRAPALFDPRRTPLRLRDDSSDALVRDAYEAARAAYAPYSGAPAGVALLGDDGRVHPGSALESVAYNPSLGALAAALSGAALARAPGAACAPPRRAVLVEASGRAAQRAQAEALLGAIAPRVALEVHAAERLGD